MQYLEWRSKKHEERSREEAEINAKKEEEDERLRLEYKEWDKIFPTTIYNGDSNEEKNDAHLFGEISQETGGEADRRDMENLEHFILRSIKNHGFVSIDEIVWSFCDRVARPTVVEKIETMKRCGDIANGDFDNSGRYVSVCSSDVELARNILAKKGRIGLTEFASDFLS